MKNLKNNKVLLLYLIVLSFVISIAFVAIVYYMHTTNVNVVFRYSILFLLTFLFSLTLFILISRSEYRLRFDRQQLKTLFRHVYDGIIILDDQKNIIEMNESAVQLLGSKVKMKDFCAICKEANKKIKICDYDTCFLEIPNDKIAYHEMQLKTVEGEIIPVSISTTKYYNPDQQMLTVLSIRNLSSIKKNEHKKIYNMITTSMIKAQEEERKRVSRELHDGIGQSIFSVLLGLEYLIPKIKDEQEMILIENLRKTTKQTLEEIRHMAAELRPSVLDDYGLIAGLKSYIKTFSNTFGIQINFEYVGDKARLPANIEIALYRIIQEALTNAAKYADTERIDLSLIKKETEVIASIMDYGIGFSLEEVRDREKGVGLYGMEERASMLDGFFHIDSEIGKGTKITVRIPLQKGEEMDE